MLKTLNLVQKQKLAKKVKPFTLKEGNMYKVGQNNILRNVYHLRITNCFEGIT
jgi:hypothetical protein